MRTGLLLILFFVCDAWAFSVAPEYGSGNGTVLEQKKYDNSIWTIRKHNQNVTIGDSSKTEDLVVYDSLGSGKHSLGKLKVGSNISIDMLAETSKDRIYYVWLHVAAQPNLSGWIKLDTYSDTAPTYLSPEPFDPYFDDRWSIVDRLTTSKVWTIRKMTGQSIAVWEVVNIRDKPGVSGTKVVSKIVPPEKGNPQVNLDVTKATEETETIDGKTDRWLFIEYHGTSGWIFGGYVSVERGGPKYFIPENLIRFHLGNQA